MIEILNEYANAVNATSEVRHWLNTTGKKALEKKLSSESDLEHVLDFLVSPAAPSRLQKMSFVDAKRKASEWTDRNKKKGRNLIDTDQDIDIFHRFEDGSAIVLLKSKSAYQREGFMMNHCVGGYDPKNSDCQIYSYRDAKNEPHATFEVRKNANEIVQIKGKGNGAIHPRYIEPVLTFLELLKMKVRPGDMKNLGYFHIHKQHIDFLKTIPGAWKQVVEVRGEYYAV